MSEIAFQPLTALARMLEARKISAVELLDLYAARIDAHNGKLNAIVTMDLDAARGTAVKMDEIRAKGPVSEPLLGVPMTIKDAFEVKGLVSTGGVTALKDHLPEQDAACVARLRQAGALIVGKTNVPAFSGDWQSYNEIYGRTNNPWDLERTPGGSSGGAAAAIAAGLTGGDIGSDIGGSIRLPAHFCGLFGHKPSYGVVPVRGHIPPAPAAYSQADLSVCGPLGRSVSDLHLLLAMMAGAPGDVLYPRPSLRKPRVEHPKNLRVAVWLDEPDASTDETVDGAVREAAEALGRAGAQLDWSARPGFTFMENLTDYVMLLSAIISGDFPVKVLQQLATVAAEAQADDISYAALQARGAVMSYGQMLSLEGRRRRIKDAWHGFFQEFDVVLCPPVSVPAIRHDTDKSPARRRISVNGKDANYFDVLHWASLATFAHLPATVAPVRRTDDGLPVGVQIIGGYLEDHTTLQVARFLEDSLGGFTPSPDFM